MEMTESVQITSKFTVQRTSPLTNLINSPEASSLHRSIRLEFDPETIAGRSDCRHDCITADFSNKRRRLTVTISNLVIKKRKENVRS